MGDTQFDKHLTLDQPGGPPKFVLLDGPGNNELKLNVTGPFESTVPVKDQIGDSVIAFLIVQGEKNEVVINGCAMVKPQAKTWQATVAATDTQGQVLQGKGKRARGIGLVMTVKRLESPNPPQVVAETWCHEIVIE